MRFSVLGPVAVVRGGDAVPLARSQRRGLLALLLLNANRIVTIAQITEAMWGGAAPPTARKQIHSAIHAIRAGLREFGAEHVLHGDLSGYAVRVGADELDLADFQRQWQQGRSAAADGRTGEAVGALRAALRVWSGPPLGGASGAFVEGARARLEEQRLTAIEDVIECELVLGRHESVLIEFGHLADQHPLRERLHGRLMLALYRSGRQPEALQSFHRLRLLLAEEQGLDPSRSLRALHDAMLREDGGLDGAMSTGDWWTATPAWPAFTPVPSATAPPTAVRPEGGPARTPPRLLPPDPPGFVGRDGYLRQLDELRPDPMADPGTTPIAVITGGGGMGKTALAVHWAYRAAKSFPDGQLFLDLRGHAVDAPLTLTEALSRLLLALGVPAEQIPARQEHAVDLYRTATATRSLLVVLDNARTAEQVRPLLPGAGMVLVTSRSRLTGLVARDGAHPCALDVLTPAESEAVLAHTIGAERMRAEPDAVRRLARLCAGLPLALRIAAANLRTHQQRPVDAYVAELDGDRRLAQLAVPEDDETALRATFDLSYLALAPDCRQLFRLLSLVPGPHFTAAAAGALARTSPAQAGAVLSALAEAHLLTEPADGCFAFHDLLRQYAADLAREQDDPVALRQALARLHGYYLHSADGAARVIYPHLLRLPWPPVVDVAAETFDEHGRASAWLDRELPNLTAVITAVPLPQNRADVYVLADMLRGYFFLRMLAPEWDLCTAAALRAAQADGDEQAQAAVYLSIADLRWRQGAHDDAIDAYTRALDLCERCGWTEGEATVVGNLGGVHRLRGDLRQAADHIARSLSLNTRLGRLAGQAVNLGNLALIHGELGRLRAAHDMYGQALLLYRQLSSRSGEAVCLTNLGEVGHWLGDAAAPNHLAAALVVHREVSDRAGEADTLRCLAAVEASGGDLAEAQRRAESALALTRDCGDRRVEANTLTTLADIHHRRGSHGVALEMYEAAATLSRAAGRRYAEALAQVGQAGVRSGQGAHDEAYELATRALAAARGAGYRMVEGLATVELARAVARSRPGDACTLGEQALVLLRETGHRPGVAAASELLAALAAVPPAP
ncbi:AfsR/SARP family transcriptional regulator [Catellatospora citrea]|uniref:SARP family transcriptional regulator n=1 Tax=Catellatospora citrea TaxID=53366 RepID=A0A8J3KBT4_9ACTN|nr:BTAD domain-containing putative transcriptional regulator [Catellatospora citrea]RKE06073.1 DNA-binding SARP family transcriptional activator [Catellatospora citrea]GIF97739.1 SARP family transcriptional regulator [Catellatospora citrea]